MIASLRANQSDVVDDVAHYLRLSLITSHHHLLGPGIEALNVESELAIEITLQSFGHGTHTGCIGSQYVSSRWAIIIASEHSS